MSYNSHIRQSAFSLIEMLVVITIIGILAALLTPVARNAMVQSQKTSCMNNLKKIAYSLNMYTNQNEDQLPFCTSRPSNPPAGELGLPALRMVLMNYISDPRIFLCPGDSNETWYKNEGLSYEWYAPANGKLITRKIGQTEVKNIALLFDYDFFHGTPNEKTAKNYLFINGEVAPTLE